MGTDRQLAGVLFAAYVVAGRPESSRVTGWITAYDDPPSLPDTAAGERMRGRATRIAALLDCDDEDRNWVTLDQGTDVALAVRRRPPVDPVLVGLLHWWRLATSAWRRLRLGHRGARGGHPRGPAVARAQSAAPERRVHRRDRRSSGLGGRGPAAPLRTQLCPGPGGRRDRAVPPERRGLLTTSFAESSPVP
ncbi:MAG: hypothetical protein R2789_12230 [Microthrixaceae bacterium]